MRWKIIISLSLTQKVDIPLGIRTRLKALKENASVSASRQRVNCLVRKLSAPVKIPTHYLKSSRCPLG
ncbi:hypothetical protein CLOSTMETH_02271 [[Clostridium] methylpentosum DSM 5476]|uniref:Uncharacterized protein n=1 Tax=[Clostridium] methylpentosum DSM 5476 TaxID=537013 RepID=C0EEI5_9FIRM|nr:hypothetical protein CLOSTMETH_02271 [[Clostridium] methylpentosum DSM 5476]